MVGAEYRTKPDNLGLGDDDWMDIFAAYALTDHLTLTAAYVDLGSIASTTPSGACASGDASAPPSRQSPIAMRTARCGIAP